MVWPVIAAAAIGAAANMYTSEQARREGRSNRKALEEAQAAEIARKMGISLPELEAMTEEQYQNHVNYEPGQLTNVEQAQSALAKYEANPELQNEQRAALAQMAELSEGGLTAGDRIALEEANLSASMGDRGRQEAILQSMARRGQAGGGSELAARLQSAQGASDNQAAAGRSAVSTAQQRALQAMAQRGSMASGMRGQDFGEQQGIARQVDAINRFNTANSNATSRANWAEGNRAQLINQEAEQRTRDTQVDTRNRNANAENVLAQQNFNNIMSREGGVPGVDPTVTRMKAAQIEADRKATMSGIKGAVDTATAAYGGYNQAGDSTDKYFDSRDTQLGDQEGPIMEGTY